MSVLDQFHDAVLRIRVEHSLEAHWRLFLAEGIGLIVLGLVALILPPLASIGIAIILGWLLLFAGVFGLLTIIVGCHAPRFLVVAHIVDSCHYYRRAAFWLASAWCSVADHDPHGIFAGGWPCHNHDGARISPGAAQPMGLAISQWRARSRLGRHHSRRIARVGAVGGRDHCGHRSRVRRNVSGCPFACSIPQSDDRYIITSRSLHLI